MSGMAMVPERPEVPGSPAASGARPTARSSVIWSVALVAGSAALGLLGGLIWGEVAPRVLLQEVSAGTAAIVNIETRAFFGADAWFSAIAVVAGLLTGVLGYRLAVAPRDGAARACVALALILGAVAGGFTMMWAGGQVGLSAFNRELGSSPAGTLFPASLALGAKSALALWPLLTALVLLIAEWGTRPSPNSPAPEAPSSNSPAPG
jgi:hypothetical protein